MITTMQPLLWLYGAWLALQGTALWLLTRRSGRRLPHPSVTSAAVIVTVICIATIAYVFTRSAGPPDSDLRLFLSGKGFTFLFASFLAWPFAASAAAAQIAGRLSV